MFSSNRWTKFAIATLLIVSQSSQATDLIYCGASRVIVIDPTAPLKPEWTWHAIDSPSIPEKSRPWFRSTDECKPYAGGLLLITSSSSGVTLIERETKRCLFLAQSRNAHSACLLPGNQIAVAASFGGDEMQFYKSTDKRRPAVPIQTIPLYGAHGCVWDAKRKCLWALGQSELLRLTVGTDGKWTVRNAGISRHPVAMTSGHATTPTSLPPPAPRCCCSIAIRKRSTCTNQSAIKRRSNQSTAIRHPESWYSIRARPAHGGATPSASSDASR